MRNFLPPETINPISGYTRAEEIAIAAGIGGRLPFDVYEDMIRRRVVPYPDKKNNARRTGQKGINKYE